MEFSVSTDIEQLAASANLTRDQVQHVIQLLDSGQSIPYLVRYRSTEVGNLDEDAVVKLRSQLHAARQLSDRKQVVLRAAAHHELLTPDLENAIRSAKTYRLLEDLHLPFRRRKRSKESHVRRERLRDLVPLVLDPNQQGAWEESLATLANDTAIAADVTELQSELRQLVGEHFLHEPAIRQSIRETIEKHALLIATHLVESAETVSHAESDAPDDVLLDGALDDHEPEGSPEPDFTEPAPQEENLPNGAAAELVHASASADSAVSGSLSEAPPAAGPSESIAQLRREQRREARRKRRRRLESYYRPFFQFRKPVHKITACEWTGLDRGERLRVIQLQYEIPLGTVLAACDPQIAAAEHPYRDFLVDAVRQALATEIPILAKEVQRDLVAAGELRWQDGQRQKLQRLVLRHAIPEVVLAIEPQIRRESTVVVLDPHGKLVAHTILSLSRDSQNLEAQEQLLEWISRHQVRFVILGDSPGYREMYPWLSEIQDQVRESNPFELALVRSAGTGMFARSAMASRELGNHPDNIRRAVSLGRRFQTPLHEYARLDIGRVARLLFGEETKSDTYDEYMQDAVRSGVARLGVDANQAEESLLRFVPAMNLAYAQRLVQARKESSGFPNRQAILTIEGIDRQALLQAVPFLRVFSSENPFDATAVHPEDEPVARQILATAGLTEQDLKAVLPQPQATSDPPASDRTTTSDVWRDRLQAVDLAALASSTELGPERLESIRRQLLQASVDPWDLLPLPPTRIGPIQFDLLQRWDQVVGIVANLAPFGAFVDLGNKLVGLLHVSRICDHFIGDPRELVDEGEQLLLWVVDVERDKGRIALSMIEPRERRERSWREKPRRETRTSGRPTTPPQQRRDKTTRPPRQFGKRAPQPVVPITEAMKEGSEPMRTFADLAQFFEHQKKGGKPGKRPHNKGQHD